MQCNVFIELSKYHFCGKTVMETSNIERNNSIHLFGNLTRPLGKTSHVSLLTETFQIILLFTLTHKPQYCWIWNWCCLTNRRIIVVFTAPHAAIAFQLM